MEDCSADREMGLNVELGGGSKCHRPRWNSLSRWLRAWLPWRWWWKTAVWWMAFLGRSVTNSIQPSVPGEQRWLRAGSPCCMCTLCLGAHESQYVHMSMCFKAHAFRATMQSTYVEWSGNERQLSTEVVVPPLPVQQPKGTFNTSVTNISHYCNTTQSWLQSGPLGGVCAFVCLCLSMCMCVSMTAQEHTWILLCSSEEGHSSYTF